ncbi:MULTISPECIES: hypothetical protein [Paenibacillus]|uniref:Uncharacterized protein n=1 Tax=Paenibacillus whitsoniae TaxID=2496558 RepID=A0A430JBW2_9BACL|nr:hypothetical protein [Paenibacillus whitsoniae]RTE08497.1 hypothetical protein EJQ19_16805 [Paenibacillus whitsoniae]
MAEVAILAYFHSPEQAEGAAAKLKALRAIDVRVDRFTNNLGFELENAMADSIVSSDHDVDTVGLDVVLTAVVDAETREQAARVIEDAGGKI